MKTRLRFPSPTSLTDKLEKSLFSLDEREGMFFMYSMSVLSLSGLNSEISHSNFGLKEVIAKSR
jgi:hypothetical protein